MSTDGRKTFDIEIENSRCVLQLIFCLCGCIEVTLLPTQFALMELQGQNLITPYIIFSLFYELKSPLEAAKEFLDVQFMPFKIETF